jgi:putative ABC transport system ATP-binding protein
MEPTHQAPVVRLEGVHKRYRSGEVEVPALNGVSLEIPAQRFTMVVGPSGSGKTTLLNLLGCVDVPTSGRLEVCGVDILSLGNDAQADFRAAHIGFVFQTFNLIPVLTAYENIEYPLLLLRMEPRERRKRTLEMLDQVGLAGLGDRLPNELSGGQRQRVAIGRALVKRPSLVLADEPTANLDSRTGDVIVDLMHRIQAEAATTFVFSTHDPRLIQRADEVFTLKDGVLQ